MESFEVNRMGIHMQRAAYCSVGPRLSSFMARYNKALLSLREFRKLLLRKHGRSWIFAEVPLLKLLSSCTTGATFHFTLHCASFVCGKLCTSIGDKRAQTILTTFPHGLRNSLVLHAEWKTFKSTTSRWQTTAKISNKYGGKR